MYKQTIDQVKQDLSVYGKWEGRLVPIKEPHRYLKVKLERYQAHNGFLEFYNSEGYEFHKE